MQCMVWLAVLTDGIDDGIVIPYVRLIVPSDRGQERPLFLMKLQRLYRLRRTVITFAYRSIIETLPPLMTFAIRSTKSVSNSQCHRRGCVSDLLNSPVMAA